jgi:hypothetical protein
MNRSNVGELGRVVRKVEQERKVRFTPTASEMLYSMVDAVTRDPHPSWVGPLGGDGSVLDGFQKDMISKLESQLIAMTLNNKTGTVSTFDLLHNASSIIDVICPFKKIPA